VGRDISITPTLLLSMLQETYTGLTETTEDIRCY